MFGKNYDKEIEELKKLLYEVTTTMRKSSNANLESMKIIYQRLDDLQQNIIDIAKVQKTHREAIEKLSGV